MTSKFLSYSPDQPYLFPPSPADWLGANHLVYFISDAVEQLDLSGLVWMYSTDERGEKAYHPQMMAKLLIYGYATGVFSSRKLEQKIKEDVAFRYLAAGLYPSHRTIRRFRETHIDVFRSLFVQVVQIAQEAKLVKLGVLAVDGTKVKANASKRKAMSYGRMLEEEKRLKGEIAELLERAQATDEEEEKDPEANISGQEIPQELSLREKRLEVIQAAKQRLEERQKQADAAKGRDQDDDRNGQGGVRPQGGRSKYQRPFGEPKAKAQENFTDPESRIMKTSSGFEQCYNAGAAVDAEAMIIVSASVTNNASDVQELAPLLEQTETTLGANPKIVLADTGFCSEENLRDLEERKITPIIALAREGKKETDKRGTYRKLPYTERLRKRLKTKKAASLYRRRKAIVEPVFGIIKHVVGFRSFLLRGLENVQGEWQLLCCAANLKLMSTRMVFQ